jgi:hypothetical protein
MPSHIYKRFPLLKFHKQETFYAQASQARGFTNLKGFKKVHD